jgi:hypothetical protein
MYIFWNYFDFFYKQNNNLPQFKYVKNLTNIKDDIKNIFVQNVAF